MPNAHSVGKFPFVPGWRSALLLFLAVVSFAGVAAAAGRVVWKRTKIEELDKSWKLAFEVHLDRAPDVAHVPVRFSFTPTAYFERSLVDGHKEPVTRTQPLEHQQPIVESVDVSFLDPASGKTAPRTRFMFQVTRDRGFEAGQYEVKITDARSGKELGGGTSLTLTGDNAVVGPDQIAGSGQQVRRALVHHDQHGFEPAQDAVASPVLRELDGRALEIAAVLLELGFESIEQREGIGGRSSEPGDDHGGHGENEPGDDKHKGSDD